MKGGLHPKVLAGVAGGQTGLWIAVIVLYLLDTYAGFKPTAVVGDAITGLIVTLVGAAAGYLTPSPLPPTK